MRTGRNWIFTTVLTLSPAFGFISVAAAPAPKVVQIVIDKATFGDAPSGVFVGDTIEWVNKDIVDHTATAKFGAWDVVVPAGKKTRVVIKKAGTFEYYCKYHPNMIGTLVAKRPAK
jgi:plastocyanin